MNLRIEEGIALVSEVIGTLEDAGLSNQPKVVFGTSFIHLESVASMVEDFDHIQASAQDCSAHSSGAFTAEVSAEQIESVGAKYVIIGHSERRSYHKEGAELLKTKISQALANGLKVIFCFGEELQDRYDKKHFSIVEDQLKGSLAELNSDDWNNIVLAYEPVWAIGTGETATSEQAQEMHEFIRKCVSELASNERAENVSILYGGSCKPSNAVELFSCPDIDGGLIGGASLNASDFISLIKIGSDELY